jgi:UDP-glucose:(heptosyl)LPS alpha-1,3-glucosyltransferase
MDDSAGRRPLKIAVLLDKFLPSRGGERYFSFLCEELTKRGHEVHVFATAVEGSELPYEVHLIRVAPFPRWLRILSFWRNSARMLARHEFDIVHGVAQSPQVNVLNPHGGVEPAYLRQEFASLENRLYFAYKWIRRYVSVRHYLELSLQRKQYRSANLKRVIAISTMIKRDISQYYAFPKGRVDVVFNSVDLDRFHPRNRALHRQDVRKELGIDEKTFLLLFAGNNFRLKGTATLIRSLARLHRKFPGRSFRLLIAGRGRASRYRALAKRLGVADAVIFAGPVSGMERYYAAADIYVHPTFYDSCSLTVLEALAAGLPVVTTRFNGASDAIVSPDAGYVMQEPSDDNELTDAIVRYMDAGKQAAFSKAARTCMEAYTPVRNVNETLETYYKALEQVDIQRARAIAAYRKSDLRSFTR